MKKKILSALLMFAGTALFAQKNYTTSTDIVYSSEDDEYAKERCKLDVYYAEDGKDLPVLVWFHGGGLTGGNKSVPARLKNSGIVIVSVNYRLIPKVGIAECIDDAAAAIAWTFRNIGKYGGDPGKIFTGGHSAGGYLVSMTGLDRKYLAKYDIDADDIAGLIPVSGQCITHFAHRNIQGIGPLQATIDEFAPLTYVRGDAPPMLIISADRELEMNGRYEEQAYFWRMLRLCGHKDVQILEMQGYNHSEAANPAFPLIRKFIKRLAD